MNVAGSTFLKDTLIDGQPARVECLEIDGQTYSVSRGTVTRVQLEDEWFDDVRDPATVIAALKEGPVTADIFTFWQRLPQPEPRFDFHTEWDSIAALGVTSFDAWWNKQIKPETRNLVRKAQKKGVEVREVRYDDDFVRGMTDIFNETPIRQGRRFWHYGKNFETVKQQFSRYLFREDLLGAYYRDELIGFVMLGNARRYALLGQIISKIQHRDKSPNNALIAKAVQFCEKKQLPYLVYGYWSDESLGKFKRHNGFQETRLPRYYVPLTRKGRVAISAGVHRGWKQMLPESVRARLKALRSRWLSLRADA
jgi:hypothetical protein